MKVQLICCVAALAAAACTHTYERQAAIAQVDGDDHVVVRAEAGKLWWAHRAWTEPHELSTLPAQGRVENLKVERGSDGFVVRFDQGGTSWSGTFGQTQAPAHVIELARGERGDR